MNYINPRCTRGIVDKMGEKRGKKKKKVLDNGGGGVIY